KTQTCPFAAMANEEKRFYGVQFHPEVTHTRQGKRMLEHFALDICGCDANWKPSSIIEDAIERLKKQIGDDEVILGLSGGVDSSVVAMLLHRAIGDKLTCVFVDNGLLRLNEAEQVLEMFGDHFGLNIVHVDAENRFLEAMAGVADPEAKRKIIGRVFVEIFDEESKKCVNAKWLAQGTIYPDVIESAGSATGKAHVIKSHHNVGGLPDDMALGLVEPLRELFKDEVRKIGLELGLPYNMLYRHPFPGPGLGVRVLGEVKKEYCDLLLDVERHINQVAFPERYKQLQDEIKRRQALGIFNVPPELPPKELNNTYWRNNEIIFEFTSISKSWRITFIATYLLVNIAILAWIIPNYYVSPLHSLHQYTTTIDDVDCRKDSVENEKTGEISDYYDIVISAYPNTF
uniref:glutamine-hydrolyzing GMP synthase n=1 Tax=Shewanella sp. TaxID=50422 RepID=UPI0040477934